MTETTKSDVLASARSGLRAGFDRLIVVATEEAALRKVERQLAETGLLAPSRIQVVSQDGFSGFG